MLIQDMSDSAAPASEEQVLDPGLRPKTPRGDPLLVGDFIYLLPADSHLDPYIAKIEKIYADSRGQAHLHVRWFYRPVDVQHPLPSSVEKDEVFHTNYFDAQPADHVLRHCTVVSRMERARLKEPGSRDVYVCRYSYSAEGPRGFTPLISETLDSGRDVDKGAARRTPDGSSAVVKALAQELLQIEKKVPKELLPYQWSDLRLSWILKVKTITTISSVGRMLLQLEKGLDLEAIYGRDPAVMASLKDPSFWRDTVSTIKTQDLMKEYVRCFKQDVDDFVDVCYKSDPAGFIRLVTVSRQGKGHGLDDNSFQSERMEPQCTSGGTRPLLDAESFTRSSSENIFRCQGDDLGFRKPGTMCEVAHKFLPSEAPLSLKFIRVVMVVEITRLHVTVKYPSMVSLQSYFNGSTRFDGDLYSSLEGRPSSHHKDSQTMPTVMGTKPNMDELFILSFELALKLLVRPVSCTELLHQAHLRSFWLAEQRESEPLAKTESTRFCLSEPGGAAAAKLSVPCPGESSGLPTASVRPESGEGYDNQSTREFISGISQKPVSCTPTDGRLLQLTRYLELCADGKSKSSQEELGCGQENVDPKVNDDVLLFSGRTAARPPVPITTDALFSGMDLIARHAVADAEKLQGRELEGGRWASRKVRFRGNCSSDTSVKGLGPFDQNKPDPRKTEVAVTRKQRKASNSDKNSLPLRSSDVAICPATVSPSLVTSAGIFTKEKSSKRPRAGSVLKLPKDMQGRWSSERYKSAQFRLIDIMHQRDAIPGKPILRPALRDEARKHIGDTGLLDHLLKHMTDTVVSSGERFRRRHNAEGAMEYWLEDSSLMEIRKTAGIDDPYWIPPPGWKPGDRVPAKGEYVYSQGMSPAEAAEMKRLQDMVTKMRSEMKSLSIQVKDLSKQVSKTSRQPGPGKLAERSCMDCADLEFELPTDARAKFEKMAVEVRDIRRKLETHIQEESLNQQSAPLHKSSLDGGQTGEIEELSDPDAQSKMSRITQTEQLEKLESQVQSISEEWRTKFDQVGASKASMEAQLSLMCKVVDRIQEDMQFIMKALGFSVEQNVPSDQMKNITPWTVSGAPMPSECGAIGPIKNCSGEASTSSTNEIPGTGSDTCSDKIQSQSGVLERFPSAPWNGRVGPVEISGGQGYFENNQPLYRPTGSIVWPNPGIPLANALNVGDLLSSQLPTSVRPGATVHMASKVSESNIHMLLRLPPKKYISNIFQHQVNLQQVIPNWREGQRFELPHPGIYMKSQAGRMLPDHQHQHQQENSEHRTIAGNMTAPKLDGPGLPLPMRKKPGGRESPPENADGFVLLAATQRVNRVQLEDGRQETLLCGRKRKCSSPLAEPSQKRLTTDKVNSGLEIPCTTVQSDELSTQLSLSLSAASTSTDELHIILRPNPPDQSNEVSVSGSRKFTTVSNPLTLNKLFDLHTKSSWLGLGPSPESLT